MTVTPAKCYDDREACPCCAGSDEGEWTDLCQPCLEAWWNEGPYPHGCGRSEGDA